MSTAKPRRLGLWVTGALVIVAVIYGFMPKPVSVETTAAVRGPLRATLREEGKTRVVDRYTISAPVAGLSQRVELEVGDAVTRGQTLLQLDPVPPATLDARSRKEAQARVESRRAALEAAEERVTAAESQQQAAEQRRARFEGLLTSGNASELELDDLRAAARRTVAQRKSAEFETSVAEHELEAAKATLQQLTAGNPDGASVEHLPIASPIDGRVLSLFRESEGVVAAGSPLLEVGDPSQLEIQVDVLSSDAVRLQEGGRVQIERWGGDRPLEGRIRRIEPVGFTKISALGVEEQRVLVLVDFITDVSERQRLGDGFRIEAVFVLWDGQDVLQVPASALFRDQGNWAVYAEVGGRAELRRVEIGHRSGLRVQISGGLDDGEKVVVHPSDSVVDGVRIKARE